MTLMRNNAWLSVALGAMVVLSLGLSYLLLYNFELFADIMGYSDRTTEVIDAEVSEYDISEFYKQTPLELTDVILPTGIYYRDEGQILQIDGAEYYAVAENYLLSKLIQLDHSRVVTDDESYRSLFNENYMELRFAEDLPLEVYQAFIRLGDRYPQDFSMNQIILAVDSDQVFLANSKELSYVEADLVSDFSSQYLVESLQGAMDQFRPMERYVSQQGFIYLPIHPLELPSQVYTLEVLPETLFVSQMFPSNSDYQANEIGQDKLVYRNFQYSLEIDQAQLILDYTINRIVPGEPISASDRIVYSFSMIEAYSYWQEAMRIQRAQNNILTYRRYLGNIPIYPASGLADYGRTQVYLRGDPSGEPYRYQSPLLVTQAHIPNFSESYTLESSEEIVDQFIQYGYSFADFQSIHVGYEWQEGMEEFKKVDFIPKWYVQYKNGIYLLEDIFTEDFYQAYQEAMTEEAS